MTWPTPGAPACSFAAANLAATVGGAGGSALRPIARAPSRIAKPLVIDIRGRLIDRINASLCHSMSVVSAHASRVTNGIRPCRSVSFASSFNLMANRQIGREKHLGIWLILRIGLYSNPAAMIAASIMHVPPSFPGKGCDPFINRQSTMWSKVLI